MARNSTRRIGVTAALVLLTVGPAAAVSADPISDKRAEAAALADKLSEQARRIVTLDAEFRKAERELGEAEAAVAQAEVEIAAATRRQDEVRRQLAVVAQDAYVTGGSVTMLRYLVTTDQSDHVTRRAYLRVVTGRDRQLIGQLRATREDLEGQRGRLDAARRRAGARAEAIGSDRRALDQAMRVQRSNLAGVNDELVGLVAAEQFRLAAEEAAARRPAPTARAAPAAPAATAAGAPASPAPAAAPVVPAPSSSEMPNAEAWACIRQLESGNNYASPSGGAYQFLDSTWQSLGYSGTASDAPPAVQDEAALKLHAQSGWRPWTVAPMCGLV